MINDKLYDWGDEGQNQEKTNRSLFDNLGDALTAIGANFSDVRGSERLGDIRDSLRQDNLTGEEINQLKQQYYDEYAKREAARQQYAQAHQNLVDDDSFLKNIDQMGGTLEGMAAQGIGTAVGAGLGFLSPVVGGTAMGAKIGNAAGAVAGGYLDARSVALQAEEEVLDAGGTWEQAKQAYDEALKKASLTTLPETLADIAMGNRLVRAGLSSGVARKIAGSTLGRAGSAVLDPAARVGTKVSRMFNPLAGRAAGWATDVALQGATEAGQEVTQDYIADREVAKALGRPDNEYSLGGFGRYALSDQGLETMKTAGIMGALFGGVGGAVSSGQYLQRGSETREGNMTYNATKQMINDGSLSIDKNKMDGIKKYLSLEGVASPTQLETWSDEDLIAEYAVRRGWATAAPNYGLNKDMSTIQRAANTISRISEEENTTIKRDNELNDKGEKFLDIIGLSEDDKNKYFISSKDKSIMEKVESEQEQQEQTKEGQQTTGHFTSKTAQEMQQNEGKSVKDVIAEEKGQTQQTEQGTTVKETVSEKSTQNNLAPAAEQAEKQGKIETEEQQYKDEISGGWKTDVSKASEDEQFDQHSYYQEDTKQTATIKRHQNGGYIVETGNDKNNIYGSPWFSTLQKAEEYLFKNKDNRQFQKGQEKQNKLPEGGVDAESGKRTGQKINNINDLFNFMLNNPNTISSNAFAEFMEMDWNLGWNGIDIYLDRQNNGYVQDEETGEWGLVHGYKDRDKSTGRAFIQLYATGDIGTAIHEIAHLGFDNLTPAQKETFSKYAIKDMGRFIANLLDMNYDNQFIERLNNLVKGNDKELQDKINGLAPLKQAATIPNIRAFLNSLNSKNGIDLNNLTHDQKVAIDERWAWEMSMWYVEGFSKGVEPRNVIERIKQRGCLSIVSDLTTLQRLWNHLHHRNSEYETPIEDMYRNMNISGEPNGRNQQGTSGEQEGQTEQYQPNFTMEEGSPARFTGEQNFIMRERVPNEVVPYQQRNLVNENNEVGEQSGRMYTGSSPSPFVGGLVMTDTSAEIVADEMLRRYGNDYEKMKSVWNSLLDNAANDEEVKWIAKIGEIAGQKYQAMRKGVTTNQGGQRTVNNNQITNNNQIEGTRGIEGTQREGLTSRNDGYFNANPPQLNPAVTQKTTVAPKVEEEFDTNDTIEEENEGEENVVGDAIEEVAENIEQIYKTELEPQEIKSIEGDINEVLDGLKNETDKTVKKISQSVGKRIEAAKSALRKSNKETDRGQEVYKLCSMSALKNVLDSRLKDGYYSKGNLNQDSVNNVGNLIKTQLGEIQEEWTKPYSDETESAARRDKAEADRIEKERKEAEKLAKKKQKKQAEVASQNLDILEQQIKNQQGEELTDDQLEEKLEKEVAKDNVLIEKTNGAKKKKKQTQTKAQEADRRQLIRAAAEKRGMLLDKNGQKPNRKNQQVNDVVEGWIDRLSKEEDYNEAMSQLQELLNSNAITEEEYNNISKGLEEHFEGEEDTESKAKQAQEILNKAFPNKVFQYAWHSTPHDFDKFTLEHLLSGEGFMAHGWGLYFAKNLNINKENYFNKFKMRESLTNYDLDYLKRRKEDLTHITGIIRSVLNNTDKLIIEWDKTWETNDLYLGKVNVGRELMDWFTPYDSNTGNSIFLDENLSKDQLIKILQRQQVKLLEKLIDVEGKIYNFHPKDSTRILLVDIPEDNVLLRENKGFKDQPPKVQIALMKLVRKEGLLNGEENTISNKDLMEHFDEILGVDIYEYGGDIYGTLSWLLEDDPYGLTDEDTTNQGKERCSKLLNKYGIKGISYDGRFDGECAVIFDDKAIDILSKFKKEEDKWKSEKVDNARNREIDKQKTQKKLEKKKNSDKRFMVHGKSAKGSPLTQEVLDKVEEEYNQKMQEKGISVIQNINMKLRNKAAEEGIENVSDKNDPTFNDKYIQIHDEVNEYFWKKYKLFRGLDGEWRFWVSDDGAKLKVSGQDLANGAKFPRTFYSVFKLSEVLSHSKLFKNYPQLKNITVLPVWNEGDRTRGSFTAGEGGGGTIRINLAHPSFYSSETVDEEVIRVLLHEIQHSIQDIEGFAQGGEVSADFLKTKPAMNFILRNKGKLILSLADKLQKGVPSYIMKINGEDQKINLSFEENPISGEYNPVVTIGGKKIPSIKNKVLSELLISINNIKEDSVKLKESDFDGIVEYLNPKETEYLSKLFKMFDSGNFSLEFENKKLSKEESIQVAKERLSFLHDKKQLGKILEDYEYGSTLNEDFNVAIENSGLSYELYKSLLGEAEARNTAESYKNKYRKGQVPMTLEESYIKAKNGTGQLRINKKRFMYSSIPMEQEQKLENDFQSHAQSMGYPKWLIRKVSNYKGKDKETLLTNSNLNYNNKGKSIKFIDYLDKYNEIMIRKNGVKRELDGRWTREYSDKDSKAKEYFTRDKFLKDALSGGRKDFELQDVFTHNLMYKNNPYLQKMDILFADKQDMIRLKMSDRDWAEHKISDPKDGKEKIVINTEKYLKLSKKERLNQLRNDILHESQHAIQYHEGFSYSTDLLNKSDDYYWKAHSEIQARKTVQRADMTQDERNNKSKLLDEKLLNSGELKKIPITINDTKERSEQDVSYSRVPRENVKSSVEKNSNTNRGEGVQSSEKRTGVSLQGNKQDNVNNRRNISTRRYQKANEKTPLEKAKEQRDARLEQQRKEGITSDFYKDVYSVSFTESARQNEENKRKMEYFDKRTEYWDRSEKDGKVTYTRKTPFEHHQKVVTYNGINDVTKEQKKKSKPAQWAEWFKDQLIKYAFNDMHFLAKAARKLGVFDAYTKLVVTKGYALKANTAMERGIKYNGEYTHALNNIIKEVGEEKQHDFIEYCIAKRILDMKELRPEIRQKMSPEEAAELIEKYENGEDAELFKKNQKDFVKYNHALLHVLVDGGVMTEEEFQHHIKNDPNFVPLAKVMDDADFGFNGIQAARSIVNVKSPIKKIGTSMREVKNPFLEMQKRTAEYYSIAARNKAGQIFVNEIAGKIDKLANGDTVARGQGMIRKVKIDEKDGKLITKPDEKQQIIYVCNNGKHEFYQVSDPEIYRALRALDADQMGTLHKMIDPFLHAPSALIRETATMVPDFGIRNLIRDGGEAFMTSEHGFLPFIDQIWGMYQMANNTEWYQRFLEQQGEYGTYNRDGANNDVARVEDTIDEKVNPIKNFNEIRRAAFEKFTNKKNSKTVRAAALLQLMGSMPYAIIKSNKRINDYLEMGTRVGEFKNAKMGYNGTLDRLSKGGILDWGADINNAKQSDILAAGVAKEITLNFGQHGIIGKQLNRYIPFFNATLQGIYKMCNALELMFTGRTLSGEKNHALQGEMLFKAALVTAMAIGVAAAGEGDDDYEEANQYEKENFWILPNGLRFPKDQVLGKLFGNVAEKSYAQWRKGKFEPSDILRSIVENFTPDKFMPAMADITLGGLFNYDTFYKSAIVPEYMQGKLGHLQKDLSTSNMASDISDFLWKYTKTDVSAKRLDWALQKNLTNCKKYIDSLYDLGKQAYDPKSFNKKMARGYDKSDSTGAFVGGLKDDVPKPLSLISGTFATNRTNYKSISDFYEKYNNLKKLATDEPSMSKEEKRAWKRYEQAYKKDKNFRKQLRAIKADSSLTGKQKRERADKIFKQQIKLAKWAEG